MPAHSPEVTERELNAEIKLYCDVISAPGPAAPLLIALHGYGASKWHALREAKMIVPAGFAMAALQGPHQHLREPKEKGGPLRFGFGWLTNFHPEESIAIHHQGLRNLIETLANEGIADRQKIFLLGFSQSCALNYRFAFSNPDLLRGVIGICGGLPGDWEANPNYKKTTAAIFHLGGNRDEYYPPERTHDYLQRLRMRAEDVSFKNYEAGHEITIEMRADIRDWLKKLTRV